MICIDTEVLVAMAVVQSKNNEEHEAAEIISSLSGSSCQQNRKDRRLSIKAPGILKEKGEIVWTDSALTNE